MVGTALSELGALGETDSVGLAPGEVLGFAQASAARAVMVASRMVLNMVRQATNVPVTGGSRAAFERLRGPCDRRV